MISILETLHRCASEYRKREEERIRKIRETANKHKKEAKKPKKKVEKPNRDERISSIKDARRCVKKEVKDPYVENAKEFLDGKKPLYEKPVFVPYDERAECFTPWCMHFTNGHCVHRECIIKKERF